MSEEEKAYAEELKEFMVELDRAIEEVGILETGEEVGLWGDVKQIVESHLLNIV